MNIKVQYHKILIMKKKYGVFKIREDAQYYQDDLHSIEFWIGYDTEWEAFEFVENADDGYYTIIPIYIRTQQKEKEEEFKRGIDFLESLRKEFQKK